MTKAKFGDVWRRVFTALETLGPTGSKSVKVVEEFSGRLTYEAFSRVLDNRLPAVLLASSGEDPQGESLDTLVGDTRSMQRVRLIVYVAAESVRGTGRAIHGAGGDKGVADLVDDVCEAVNGVYVPGLSGTRRVHYAGFVPTPLTDAPGPLFVYAMRFWADRQVVAADLPDDAFSPPNSPPATPVVRVDVDVNGEPSTPTDSAARPLARGRADNLDD